MNLFFTRSLRDQKLVNSSTARRPREMAQNHPTWHGERICLIMLRLVQIDDCTSINTALYTYVCIDVVSDH